MFRDKYSRTIVFATLLTKSIARTRRRPIPFVMDVRRRFFGPEVSVRPVSATKATCEEKKTHFQGIRLDGRSIGQLQPFFVKTGAVKNASGSCFLEHASTKIICAVYGPRQSSSIASATGANGHVNCDFKFAPFSSRTKRRPYHKDEQEREWGSIIVNTLQTMILLDRLPNSCIDVNICVLEGEKEGVLSDAINAAIVAVIHANIEVSDVLGSCQIGTSFDENSQSFYLVDPSEEEEASVCDSLITAVYSPAHNEFVQLLVQGTSSSAGMTPENLQDALQWSIDASCKIVEFSKNALAKK